MCPCWYSQHTIRFQYFDLINNSHPLTHSSLHSSDSSGRPRCITNSKGRKRRPATRDLLTAIKTNDLMFLDFIKQCLQWDPKKRLSPDDALHHAWILEVSGVTLLLCNLRCVSTTCLIEFIRMITHTSTLV